MKLDVCDPGAPTLDLLVSPIHMLSLPSRWFLALNLNVFPNSKRPVFFKEDNI